MERYLFKPNYDLLDLNAMEMDAGLIHFFEQHQQTVSSQSTIEYDFVNKDGLVRKIKVNLEEQLLQGRGIKGFFAVYKNADFLSISCENETSFRVSDWEVGDTSLGFMKEQPAVLQRGKEVLQALGMMKQQEPEWFELYTSAWKFAVTGVDDLVCLPHLRDLQPYEFQLNTVKAVIGRFKGRALLCDEVGLGKTIEAGLCMMEYIMRGLAKKILILAPPSLINQWYEELNRKFNQDFIKSDDPQFVKLGADAWQHYNRVIASTTTAKRANNSRVITELHYDLVIVDEAHHLKNRSTVAWQFVNSLKKKYMLLLTATPVQNSLEELYNLITLLKPGQLKTYQHFRSNFVEDNLGIEVKNADKLKALLAEVMIRNRRSSVDVKFTQRKATTRTVQLSTDERRLYTDLSQFIRSNYSDKHPVFSRLLLKNMQEQMGSSFSAITGTLSKLSEHPELTEDQRLAIKDLSVRAEAVAMQEIEQSSKIKALLELINTFGDKLLIFTKYRTTQQILVQALKRNKLQVAEFHGGLLRKDKEREIAFFRDQADVLISTEVGGEGRNLQFCNAIVNYDLPWNPMAIEQRIGRIHRIGQTRDVFVYNLAAEHTLEHHMLYVLDRKINLFELVVGEVDMILGDIEEKEEFSDLVMDAWVRAESTVEMDAEMDKIGQQLLDNKQKLQRVKELDERLFV